MDPWLTLHAVVMVALFLLPALTLVVTYLRHPGNESMRVNVAWAFALGLAIAVVAVPLLGIEPTLRERPNDALMDAVAGWVFALYMGFVFLMLPVTLTLIPLFLLAFGGFFLLMLLVSMGALFAVPFTAGAVGLAMAMELARGLRQRVVR
jgi:hypothetical protein